MFFTFSQKSDEILGAEAGLKAIAFERDIERLTESFTGRERVFEEIDRWLQQENERFFILTGEPGVGKSAIARSSFNSNPRSAMMWLPII